MVLKSSPLQIVRPRIPVLLVRTERADITRRVMDQPMPYHFILSLETLPSDSSRAVFDRAIMGPTLRMNICVRASPESQCEARN
jgi:hypothetical protein